MVVRTRSPRPQAARKPLRNGKNSLRNRILDAAATVFLEQGFAKARVSQIIELSGVSRSSLYDNFSGKEQLVTALVYQAHEEGLERTEQIFKSSSSATEGIREWLRSTLHLEDRYRNLIKFMHQDDEIPNSLLDKEKSLADFRKGMKVVQQVLRRGISDGEFKGDLNIKRTAQTLQNIHHILGLVGARDQPLIDFLGKDGDMLIDFIVDGLGAPNSSLSIQGTTCRKRTTPA